MPAKKTPVKKQSAKKAPAKAPAKKAQPSAPAVKTMKVSEIKIPQALTQEQLIRNDMTMGDILSRYPDAAFIMLNHGLHCIGCHVSPYESIEQGSMGHGMPEEEFHALMKELNQLAAQKQAGKKDTVMAEDLKV